MCLCVCVCSSNRSWSCHQLKDAEAQRKREIGELVVQHAKEHSGSVVVRMKAQLADKEVREGGLGCLQHAAPTDCSPCVGRLRCLD